MTNYLGPYMLTRLLEDKLLDTSYGFNMKGLSSSSSKATRQKPTTTNRTARVVNVSSVTHRYGLILPTDIDTFLKTWKLGSFYPNTKLANVLFSYELTRRLGSYGLQSCAVDPGGVASNIWKNSAFSRAPLSWVIGNLYAPPIDGAAAVVYAATVDWEDDREEGKRVNRKRYVVDRKKNRLTLNSGDNGTGGVTAELNLAQPSGCMFDMDRPDEDSRDFRYYARGMFASPFITNTGNLFQRRTISKYLSPHNTPGPGTTSSSSSSSDTLSWSPPTVLDKAKRAAWAASTVIHSLLDWPLRRVSGGRIAAKTVVVPSAPMSYDTKLAADLWDVSARFVGVPSQPLISAGSLAK